MNTKNLTATSQYNLHLGDNLATLKNYPDNTFDSIITDPPYGIDFLGKEWDSHTGTVELYKECLRVLKPGGYLLAFSAARTYHKLAYSVELAGFEIRDQLMWLYSSGFPKAQDIGKAIQKRLGVEESITTEMKQQGGIQQVTYEDGLDAQRENISMTQPVCTSPLAKQWEGWKTSLKPAEEPVVMARKPAYNSDITLKMEELCSLVKSAAHNSKVITTQKISQTEISTVLINARNQLERIQQGQEPLIPIVMWLSMMAMEGGDTSIVSLWNSIWVGHLHATKKCIIETKISTITELKTLNYLLKVIIQATTTQDQTGASTQNVNAITAAVNLCDLLLKLLLTQRLTAQDNVIEIQDNPNKHNPIVMARKPYKGSTIDQVLKNGLGAMNIDATRVEYASDKDVENRLSALKNDHSTCGLDNIFRGVEGITKLKNEVEFSEEFVEQLSLGRYPSNVIGEVAEGYQKYFYCPKVSRKERHSGFEAEIEGIRFAPEPKDGCAAIIEGHGDQRCSDEQTKTIGNNHPTVKPVALMDYLIKLVTPPSTPTLQRKVLDPFMGSGSTGMAATKLGHHFTGCELDPKYVAIASTRIDAWNAVEVDTNPLDPELFGDD